MKKITLILLLITAFCHAQQKAEKDVFDTARYGTLADMQKLHAADKDIINAISPMGFTPLILACYRGNNEVAEYLAINVKNINQTSDNGTALAAVAVKGNTALAKILLENKADPNIADTMGITPLIYAIQFENKELVELLLKYKASKTVKDKEGKTPMDYAIFTNNNDIINLLKK